jgi:hypothetical protein
VAHVEEARWVWQHLKRVELGTRIIINRAEGLLFIPPLLPFLFDLFGKVFFVH